MLGNGRLAHVERLGQLIDRGFSTRQPGQNGPAGGIGQRRKGGVESGLGGATSVSELHNYLVIY